MSALTPGAATTAPRRANLPTLTGMRFLASGMVFFSHAFFRFLPSSWTSGTGAGFWWSAAGSTGVSFFFVLSGFVLTWSARPGEPARAFWRRRLCKIYPNHLVTAVAAVALMLVCGETFTAGQLVPNLLLVQSWIPRFDVLTGINQVSWSLCCEALFYLSFPLLLPLVGRIRAGRLWWWAGGAALAVWCVPAVSALLLSGGPHISPRMDYSVTQLWFVYFFPVMRVFEFVLGMLLARIVLAGRWPRIGLLPAAMLFLAGYAGALYAPGQFGTAALTVVPLALLIPAGAAADLAGRRSFLSSRVAVWLGEVSFALYMVHQLVITYGAKALGIGMKLSTVEAAALSLPFLAASLLAAWLLYTVVEQPMMRRWSRARRPGTAAPRPARQETAGAPSPERA
ncbi:acyltransferase family protein [Kitasatospora sp. NPDC053057]|uniref:acyltransferase family protein n=1 Tax=Kitasatospora sp. NPDC053057 TaxID=3364062 RepID=UPI0037C5317E